MGIIKPRATVLREALEQKRSTPQLEAPDVKTLLTVNETLAMLRISRHTLYGYLHRNELSSVRFGKRRFFRHTDLLAFIEKHQAGTSA